MNTDRIIVEGAEKIQAQLETRARRITVGKNKATQAAANVYKKALKRELPRDPKSSHPGYLRSHVNVYAVAEGEAEVKLTGRLAHLYIGDTKAHETDPLGLEDSQRHSLVRGKRLQGPVQLKRAMFYAGAAHPFARASIPAHRGDHELIPRVKVEYQQDAAAAAIEVIRNG
jgi:hypothetical protein